MSEDIPMDKRVVRRQRNGNQKSSIADYKEVSKNKSKESANGRPPPPRQSGLDTKKPSSEPQRNNFYQKRPQPRGNPEVGSIQRPGSKKSGCIPKEEFDSGQNHGLRRSVSDFGFQSHYQFTVASNNEFYNKEQHVHALCQFVVLDGTACRDNLRNPDLPVDWDLVQEVRVLDDQLPACPICLYPPVAAKMTQCGHVFCWPCILHYLALSDKTWRKCPICYDSIYRKQLRSVFVSASWQPRVGDDVTFVLMKRRKGANLALPVPQWKEYEQLMSHSDSNSQWSKIVTMGPSEIMDRICVREMQELEKELQAQWDQPEKMFIEDAIAELNVRKGDLAIMVSGELATPSGFDSSVAEETGCNPQCAPLTISSGNTVKYVNAFDDAILEEEDTAAGQETSTSCNQPDPSDPAIECQSLREEVLVDALEGLNLESNSTDHLDEAAVKLAENDKPLLADSTTGARARASQIGTSRGDEEDFYYFYQAADCGQKLMLHPVNTKCLIVEYGSLHQAPLTVNGRLVELERMVMDGNVRRRFRSLGHFPVTTEFQLAEIRFDRSVISRRTFEQFSGEFQKRRETRQRRNRKDRWQDKRAEFWHQSVMVQQRVDCGYTSGILEQPMGPDRNMNPDIPVIKIVKSAQDEIRAGLRTLSGSEPPDVFSDEPAILPLDLDGPPIGMAEEDWLPPVATNTGPWGRQVDQSPRVGLNANNSGGACEPIANSDGGSMSFAQKLRCAPKRAGIDSGGKSDSKPLAPSSPIVSLGGEGAPENAEDADEMLLAPDFRNAFSDSVAAALDAMNSAKAEEKASAEAGERVKKKTKKRTRGIVLFST